MAKCCVVFSQLPFEDLTAFRVRYVLLLVSILTSNAPGQCIMGYLALCVVIIFSVIKFTRQAHYWQPRSGPIYARDRHLKDYLIVAWWRHMTMMTSSNGDIFRVTGHLCREFTGPGEFPTQRPVMRSFDIFFDLRLNKQFSKQSWGWWFETLSRSLWRHRNGRYMIGSVLAQVMACYLTPPSHAWTNIDFSSVRFPGLHLGAISQLVVIQLFCIITENYNYWNT